MALPYYFSPSNPPWCELVAIEALFLFPYVSLTAVSSKFTIVLGFKSNLSCCPFNFFRISKKTVAVFEIFSRKLGMLFDFSSTKSHFHISRSECRTASSEGTKVLELGRPSAAMRDVKSFRRQLQIQTLSMRYPLPDILSSYLPRQKRWAFGCNKHLNQACVQ